VKEKLARHTCMLGFQPLRLALAAATAAEVGGIMPAALVRPWQFETNPCQTLHIAYGNARHVRLLPLGICLPTICLG
jgi:hypothetical protein